MIIANAGTEVTGNLVFKNTIKMKIDDGASALIIRTLTNLYSNPYTAALREYASNAYDSHIKAGQTRPVEISLPSALSPNLVIQDWGVGLTRDELANYGQYGATTKGASNEEVGGFGLGTKSGLAVASQFTVTAVKDGRSNTAVIKFDETGAPIMGMMDERDSSEPNGVRVSIPTNEVEKFERAMRGHFFLGWKPGTIKIDGQSPEFSVHDPELFTEVQGVGWIQKPAAIGLKFSDSRFGRAVVGPVEYRFEWYAVDPNLSNNLRTSFLPNIVLNLPIGSVDLPPNRESLTYSARTRRVMSEQIQKLREEAQKTYEAQVEGAATLRDALIVREQALSSGFTGPYSWQGTPLKFQENKGRAMTIVNIYDRLGDNAYYTQKSLRAQSDFGGNLLSPTLANDNRILVVNAGGMAEPVPHSRYNTSPTHLLASSTLSFARGLAETEDVDIDDIHLSFVSETRDELDPLILAAYKTVIEGPDFAEAAHAYRSQAAKAARLRRKVTPVADRTLTVRRVVYGGGYSSFAEEVDINDLDATKTYIIVRAGDGGLNDSVRKVLFTQRGRGQHWRLSTALQTVLHKDSNNIILLANKSTKTTGYASILPNLMSLTDVVNNMLAAAIARATPEDLLAEQTAQNGNYHWVSMIKPDHVCEIENPDTRAWVEARKSRANRKDFETVSAFYDASEYFGLDASTNPLARAKTNATNHYRLLDSIGYSTQAHSRDVVEYINLKDRARLAAEAETADSAVVAEAELLLA